MRKMMVVLSGSQRRRMLLAGMTAVLFAALPAQAQEVCADPGDVPEDVTELYLEELEEEFDVDLNDAELCEKLTENFVKACQSAVKDAVKCIQNQIKTLNKQNQTLCKALAPPPEVNACTTNYKNSSKAGSEAVAEEGELQAGICESLAAFEFNEVCLFGF